MRSAAVGIALGMVLGVSPAFGQAMVEAAGASSAASGSAGPLKGLGDAIKGVLGGVDNSLKSTTSTTVVHSSGPVTTVKTRTRSKARLKTALAEPAVAKPVYEDPQKIQAGITYEDLMHRFGPPAMRWTEESGATKLTYLTKAGPIELQFAADGKVSSVGKPQL